MIVVPRSRWSLTVLFLTFALLATSLFLPWFSYHRSSGTQNPPPTTQSPDPTVQRSNINYGPYAVHGDANQTQRADAERPTLILGALASGAAFLAFLNLALEAVFGPRESTRTFQMVLGALTFLVTGAALAWAWFALPPLLESEGVHSTFTSHHDDHGFLRTSVSWGWSVAAVSLVFCVASIAFKYAGAAFDHTFVERYKSRER